MGKKDVAAVVEEFMSCIKESMMERKENVYLRGFGSFVVKQRAEKTARNISKNITITIPLTSSRHSSRPSLSSTA